MAPDPSQQPNPIDTSVKGEEKSSSPEPESKPTQSHPQTVPHSTLRMIAITLQISAVGEWAERDTEEWVKRG